MSTSAALFFDEDDVDAAPSGPPAIILDRSTVERTAACPHQGALVDGKFVSSGNELTDVGTEVHAILSRAVSTRIDGAAFGTVRDEMEAAARAARTDVQPQVIDALNVYRWASLICYSPDGPERHPDDILRYDGGAVARSGQLAAELIPATDGRGPVWITGELDLLTATASTEQVDLDDWKSGFRHWTAAGVLNSFQFRWYALLVWLNYPGVMRVRVRVVETRSGATTAPVVFTREKHQHAITAQVRAAVENHLLYRGLPPEQVPAWPAPDKCAVCDAALRCRVAHEPAVEVARDPEAAVRQLVVLEAASARLRASLSIAVREAGHDLDFGDVAFGTGKPRKSKAAPCDVYTPHQEGV